MTDPSTAAARPTQADVVVVGGGHNGLTCAAYLARAGKSVVVIEARATIGGCASTVPAIGARVNICNCDHTMVLASGIINDLALAGQGLRYLDVDPMVIAVGWADEPVFIQWRSVQRTLDGLTRINPRLASAYQRYLDAATPVAKLVLAVQAGPPSTASIVTTVARQHHRISAGARLLNWARRSLVDVLSEFGLPPWIIAAASVNGPAVWGLPPDAAGTGVAAIGMAVRHLVGVGRPVGGSGALTDALALRAQADGAVLVCGTRVIGLDVAEGAARGVYLDDGSHIGAGAVVGAIDPRVVMADWLAGEPAAAKQQARWAAQPGHDGYESKLDAVVSALPTLHAVAALPSDVLPAPLRHIPTTLVCPTLEQQSAAAVTLASGAVSDPPMLLLNTPSALDASLRPGPDRHVLSLEVLWTPYDVAGGWTDSAQPWSWLQRLAGICEPGLVESVQDWRAMTPPEYEDQFSMARGYAPSFPGGVVAALLGRQPELSRYTTPVAGLFLSGAGTFPGAGVWGASGRNAALKVLARR